MSMTKKELFEALKDCPDDARISVYVSDDKYHGVLPNVFVKRVIVEDYDEHGVIADLVI